LPAAGDSPVFAGCAARVGTIPVSGPPIPNGCEPYLLHSYHWGVLKCKTLND